MITKQKQLFYFVAGKPYASLEEAQKEDLLALMREDGSPVAACTPESLSSFALWMLEHSKEIVDTLTTTPRSRLRGRKLHGAKPRTKKNATSEVPRPDAGSKGRSGD